MLSREWRLSLGPDRVQIQIGHRYNHKELRSLEVSLPSREATYPYQWVRLGQAQTISFPRGQMKVQLLRQKIPYIQRTPVRAKRKEPFERLFSENSQRLLLIDLGYYTSTNRAATFTDSEA